MNNRILCIGDSITSGINVPQDKNYPYLIAKAMGNGFVVENLGVPGATMSLIGDKPYTSEKYVKQAKAKSLVSILFLGTNDGKNCNWIDKMGYKSQFAADYKDFLG